MKVENINRKITGWAIIRNGNSPGEFYAGDPIVGSWAKGSNRRNKTTQYYE